MTQKLETVLFFGSGPVAATSLQNLIDNFEVECVVTKRRPLHHKDPAPVETLANKHNLRVIYADNKIELDELFVNQSFISTVGIVIDYGVIISESVINSFQHGIINSHFSLLPQWRGADPITFSILSGQSNTGVSLMTIDQGLDTGAIIAEAPVVIDPTDTNQTLTQKLIDTSNSLINTIVPDYLAGNIVAIPQNSSPITYSRKLTKADGILDFNKPAAVLEREIRAYSDWPKSRTVLGNIEVIVTKATALRTKNTIGEIQITDDKQLIIGTKNGTLAITELMPLGKQKMPVAAFLNGYANRIV